ncbi:MAG: SPFH domain-containing protein [Myxococcota bacterium]|nr:SPFH domain-containing protein [Myxococcota bacterium]
MTERVSRKRTGIIISVVALLLAITGLSSEIFETNMEGYYQVKQAAISGEMTVRNQAGLYPQLFGHITTYQVSDMYYFSKSSLDGGDTEESAPIKVRFNDGGTALVSGSIKYRLSSNEDHQLALHRDFKRYEAVKNDLVRQVVTEALMQTATLMKAEESYSTRRSEFTALAEEQIKDGIYETESSVEKEKDAEGNEFVVRSVFIKGDKIGKLVVRKDSPFLRYEIKILQFVIKDIDFDQTIDALIAKKKEAEQQKVVAQANAEKAKQDAITAREQGAANVAKAKAAEEVEKIRAVTKAQKEKEVAELNAAKEYAVAQLNRQKAEEDSKAALVKGEADAKVAKLKVAAGLSPREAAEFHMQTAIGVAEQLKGLQLPQLFITGSGSGGKGQVDPFSAVGLESFMRISEKLTQAQ